MMRDAFTDLASDVVVFSEGCFYEIFKTRKGGIHHDLVFDYVEVDEFADLTEGDDVACGDLGTFFCRDLVCFGQCSI